MLKTWQSFVFLICFEIICSIYAMSGLKGKYPMFCILSICLKNVIWSCLCFFKCYLKSKILFYSQISCLQNKALKIIIRNFFVLTKKMLVIFVKIKRKILWMITKTQVFRHSLVSIKSWLLIMAHFIYF